MWALRKSRNGPLRCIQDTNCPTFFGLYTSKRIFDQEKVEQHSFDQEKVEQKKKVTKRIFFLNKIKIYQEILLVIIKLITPRILFCFRDL